MSRSAEYPERVIFERMQLWMDPVSRPGPEAMAVDEWLLETTSCPVLRVYAWEGAWASLGYFGRIGEAQESLADVSWVRRWTGGGLVDHRADWTYTLVVPKTEPVSSSRGAESYREIHRILSLTLATEGIESRLCGGDLSSDAAWCFENPVSHDLLGSENRKLAGAGQRRSRTGLLHQGSVAIPALHPTARAEKFASLLAKTWQMFEREPCPIDIERRTNLRYSRDEWLFRR